MGLQKQHIIRYTKTLAKIAGVFLLIAIIAFFGFRNLLLHKVLDKIAGRLEAEYHTRLTYGEASFSGLSSVEIKQLVLVPEGRDTLLYVDELQSGVRFGYALLLDFRLAELSIRNSSVHLVKRGVETNLDRLLKRDADSLMVQEEETVVKEVRNSDYAKTIYRLISRMLNQIPSKVLLENCSLRMTEDEEEVSFDVKQLGFLDGRLESELNVVSGDTVQNWIIRGSAQPSDKKADIRLYNKQAGMVRIPYLSRRFNLNTGFDSVHFNLASVSLEDDVLKVQGFASVSNFLVNHPKISKKDVVIEHANFNYTYLISDHSISLDSSSTVQFNAVTFHPFIQFESSPDTVIRLGVQIPQMKAQAFIDALPEGLFTHFKGMEVDGEFAYRLDFSYNENKPQDLVFESNLKKYDLNIRRYGEANLGKLNGDFVYVPVEYGRPQRPIDVSPANPDYTPLDQISPYLRKSVLTTEDPSFFYHRGFIDEAFRQSIIKNIRKRKFARGASTISMQLVKNVFLTREKTLSRKLEEILLVYILENNHLCSKERMFEVYLNIIEWGPGVYGVGEASRFYFEKRPADLTLSESLFLATIIPRPKGFMWRFDKQGNLREFAGRQFHFLTNLMIRREVLVPEDTLSLTPGIIISGRAKDFIKLAPDTTITDTLINPERIDFGQ